MKPRKAILTVSAGLVGRVRQVEAAFGAVQADVDTVESPIDAGEPFLDRCHAYLQILYIMPEPVDFVIKAAQIDQEQIVRLIAYASKTLFTLPQAALG